MIAPVLEQRMRRRASITVWLERVVLHGAGGETLEVRARIYPDPGIVVLEEVSSDGSLSVVADVREILLELARIYPETLGNARVAMVQPVSLGWRPVWRQELVRLTKDTSLPTR